MKLLTSFTLLIASMFFLTACESEGPARDGDILKASEQASTTATESSAEEKWLSTTIGAHQVAAFRNHDYIEMDLELYFRGKLRFNGRLVSSTNSREILLERQDGATLYFDGQDVWKAPAGSDWKGARFDIFTWQYFALAAYKLGDPGTNWELLEPQSWENIEYNRAKLTFDSGVGDAPDDWYIAYTQPGNDFLYALAYIVTYGGRSADEAEPHAITYTDYQPVNGIPFAHRWEFWMWYEDSELGEQLGEANITNVRFFQQGEASVFADANAELVAPPES